MVNMRSRCLSVFLSAGVLAASSAANAAAFQDDGACGGPPVGIAGNDSDNTFHSLAVHPTNADIIMIGSEGNGMFKSEDRGVTWTRNNTGLYYTLQGGTCAYPEIYELVFDWNDPGRVFAAATAGPRPTTTDGTGGFYYSTDAGETWTRSITGLHNHAVVSVAQDPSDPEVLYAGMDNAPSSYGGDFADNSGPNMYKSTDGGLTWTGLQLPVVSNRVTHIIVHPTEPGTVYCAGFNTSAVAAELSTSHLGLARSTDGGETWTRINQGIAALTNCSISMDPLDPSTLYASAWASYGVLAYKSIDGGDTWSLFTGDWGLQGISELAVSPFDSDTIIGHTTAKLYTTSNAGNTWWESSDFSGSGIVFNEIEFSGSQDVVYGSADHLKVYISTNGGSFFSPVPGDLQTLIGH